MSTNLVSFSFEENNVRTVVENDTPCWVAKDVCNVLGYVNDADAIAKHCKGVAKRYPLQTPGGMQEVRVISEPDLLRLIIGSRLPAIVFSPPVSNFHRVFSTKFLFSAKFTVNQSR